MIISLYQIKPYNHCALLLVVANSTESHNVYLVSWQPANSVALKRQPPWMACWCNTRAINKPALGVATSLEDNNDGANAFYHPPILQAATLSDINMRPFSNGGQDNVAPDKW